MHEVQAADAREQFTALLDAVEHGETIVITREGKAVARMIPERTKPSPVDARAAVNALLELRSTLPRVPLEELLSWREEGCRF